MNETMVALPLVPTRITDPDTLKLLAEQLVASVEERIDPQPEPEPIPLEQAPQLPQVRPPVASRMARAWLWLIAQVQTPYRTKRAAIALLRAPVKAWSFLMVITSMRVTPERKAERDAACAECPFRHYRMRRTRKGVVMDEHCSKCGCPDWRFSRNTVRNEFSGWLCPERRHPGPYPEDDLKEHLEACGYDPKAVFGGGGCTGCGCGKAKAGA